jgi:ligand-binding sensor domain-containing protein
MKKITIGFLLFLCVAVQARNYQFTRLDNTNGLTNNQIESIFRDSRGFMWFGTNYGINRYDGYSVKTYKADKNDSTSLLYNVISEMQEDYQGNLWLKGNPHYVLTMFARNIYPQHFGMAQSARHSLSALTCRYRQRKKHVFLQP